MYDYENKLFLLLAILLGMIPMSYTHANDSIPKSVILYTPYTKISVSPGASIDYSIDLINNTDQLTNANLSVSGLSASWKHEMKSGGWSLSQLSVLPKEKKTFNLKVEVPLKVNKGNYHFVVYAGNAKLPLDVVVAQKEHTRLNLLPTNPTCREIPNQPSLSAPL